MISEEVGTAMKRRCAMYLIVVANYQRGKGALGADELSGLESMIARHRIMSRSYGLRRARPSHFLGFQRP